MGKYDRYWEMHEGGPHDEGEDVFKCTDCGAVTYHDDGYNGEPDPGQCGAHCKSRGSDWKPGNLSRRYKDNLRRIFPDSPGAKI